MIVLRWMLAILTIDCLIVTLAHMRVDGVTVLAAFFAWLWWLCSRRRPTPPPDRPRDIDPFGR